MTKVEWLGIKAEIQSELNKAAIGRAVSDPIRIDPITVTWPAFAGDRFPTGGSRLRPIGLVS
jgi:hypothetical protein